VPMGNALFPVASLSGKTVGEFGNGGATSTGRTEYIWLPTDDGSAIPVAVFRNNRYYNIHSDHLGTPRIVTDDQAKPVWQWAYSAFGDNKPTGILKATTNPNSAITNQPVLLQATGVGTTLNLRFPGQYADSETGLFYNYYRSYMPNQDRYTQNDLIGLAGGSNRVVYANANALSYTDALGLMGQGSGGNGKRPSTSNAGANGSIGGGFSFHLPIGIGLGLDGGIATDTAGNMCLYSMVCYTVGPPGISGSLGGVASAGSGQLSTGVTDYQGVCWNGGAGIAGGGSILFGNDGSAQVGRGLAGVGGGASIAYQSCKQMLLCRNN
jgi:RHS repeat-associated protein